MSIKLGDTTIEKLYLGSTEIEKIYQGDTAIYEGDEPTPPTPHDYSQDYLTFVAKGSGSFRCSSSSNMYFSLNSGTTWLPLRSGVNVNSGTTVMWKGTTTPTTGGIGTFIATTTFEAQGNIMSIVYGDNFTGDHSVADYQFRSLFSGCTGLTSAENLILPVTEMAQYCYQGMFNGCTSLTTAPELPATTLDVWCYAAMFQGCTSLTTAPAVLPATTLAERCYAYMFNGCTSLTTAPSILPATTLTDGCYYYMFTNCTSLTTAPQLPATTLVQSCYYQMFNGCTSLSAVTCLATDISANSCTGNWLYGVAASGTFYKALTMTGWTSGSNGIPYGWTEDYSESKCIMVDSGGGVHKVPYTGSAIYDYNFYYLTESETYAITHDYTITAATIGASITILDRDAFYDCDSLTSITIPSSVTEIRDSVFEGCTALTSITVEAATPPTIGYDVFANTNDCPIYVPCENEDDYKSDWSDYESRIQGYGLCLYCDRKISAITFGNIEDVSSFADWFEYKHIFMSYNTSCDDQFGDFAFDYSDMSVVDSACTVVIANLSENYEQAACAYLIDEDGVQMLQQLHEDLPNITITLHPCDSGDRTLCDQQVTSITFTGIDDAYAFIDWFRLYNISFNYETPCSDNLDVHLYYNEMNVDGDTCTVVIADLSENYNHLQCAYLTDESIQYLQSFQNDFPNVTITLARCSSLINCDQQISAITFTGIDDAYAFIDWFDNNWIELNRYDPCSYGQFHIEGQDINITGDTCTVVISNVIDGGGGYQCVYLADSEGAQRLQTLQNDFPNVTITIGYCNQ